MLSIIGDICKACEKDGWSSSLLIISLFLLPLWSTYSPSDFNPLFSQLFKNRNHSLSTFSTNFNTFVRSSMNCKKVVTFFSAKLFLPKKLKLRISPGCCKIFILKLFGFTIVSFFSLFAKIKVIPIHMETQCFKGFLLPGVTCTYCT